MFHVIVAGVCARNFSTREAASTYANRMMRLHGASNVVYNFARIPGWKVSNAHHFVPNNDGESIVPRHARMGVAL